MYEFLLKATVGFRLMALVGGWREQIPRLRPEVVTFLIFRDFGST
jgi:hypothetical protein